ncbi:MAG: tyrosine/phenylalanine carboxypeptidase domain-containing protein [Planctomycetota bacterium]
MAKSKRSRPELSATLIDAICDRLAQNKQVRRTLPRKGRVHIDRQLPFLCVYRQPTDREDVGTRRLVKGEASYLVAPGDDKFHDSVSTLVREVVKTLSREFGAFLIIEVWAAPDGGKANDPAVPTVLPKFTIHAPAAEGLGRTIEALEKRLLRIKVLKQGVDVEIDRQTKCHPNEMRPLLSPAEASELNCSLLGVSVPPVYRRPKTQQEFPQVMRSLGRSLDLALRQTFYEFTRSQTTHRPPHYHALGRKAVVKSVWEVDRRLAEVGNQFDYLLQLTPVNANDAFEQFRGSQFARVPEFHYRPLPVDTSLLKRQLYNIPIERVEDPALERLFLEKQEELDIKLSMLRDRDTPKFLYESFQLFGGVKDDLLELANSLLEQVPPGSKSRPESESVDAAQFASRAEAEINHYRSLCPGFSAKVRVSGDVANLIVSRGSLLVSKQMKIPATRVEPLLAHEIGTHLLTYYNGKSQPFQQLYSGLAGYEELQEGMAVLSEYLVGGLTSSRMRQLAARVVAARQLTDGASFVDTFRTLDEQFAFSQQAAYTITMRIYRGGGLTKDAIYLRGLRTLLRYIQRGGDLAPLYVGKMAEKHIPLIQELQYRNVLAVAPLQPRFLETDAAQQRLKAIRTEKLSVLDLVMAP